MDIEANQHDEKKMGSSDKLVSPFEFPIKSKKINVIPEHLRNIFILFCSVGIVWFFSLRIKAYFEWPPQIYSDEEVFNLTKEEINWDVFYGESPICGPMECHLLSNYEQSNYTKQMVLPAREFPLLGYKKGQTIYVRSTIKLPDYLLVNDQPIAFHSTYIFAERYDFYINQVLIDSGSSDLLNITIPREFIGEDGTVHLAFKINPGGLAYQGLAHRGDIVIGPKDKLAETRYVARDLNTNVHLWFMLPKITFCAMFIFIYLSVFRSLDMFAFICYAFLNASEIFLRSGFLPEMLPWIQDGEIPGMTVRNFSYFALFMFICEFFRQRNRKVIQVFYIILLLHVAYILLAPAFISHQIHYQVLDIMFIVVRPIVIGFAVYAAHSTVQATRNVEFITPRSRFARILLGFFLVYFLFCLSESFLTLLDIFGLNANRPILLSEVFDLVFFFGLAAITAIEFGYEISAKQRIENELKTVEERLELGRTVQKMLLPQKLSDTKGNYSYKFFYQPHEKMSGDWLSSWYTGDKLTLIIGDVVGKGPQAALAVAAIAAAIDEAKGKSLDLLACMHTISSRLFNLFNGRITSTVSAAVFSDDGTVEVCTAGSSGWVMMSGSKSQIIICRGDVLGLKDKPDMQTKELSLNEGDILFSFTDGCLEGARPIKNLLKNLANSELDDPDLFNLIIHKIKEAGKGFVYQDDQTIIVAQKKTRQEQPPAAS